MKSFLSALAVAIVVAGCASSAKDDGPSVQVHITPLDTSSNLFYFPGPIGLRYEVSITNPLAQPVTLRRLDLRTLGPGAYALHTGATPMNVTIPASSTKSFSVSTWGQARGGYLSSTEPVTLHGTAYFEGPNGVFVKLFNENVTPL